MLDKLQRTEERGQGLVEYALIMVLVAIVVIVVLVTMGPALSGVYCSVIQELNSSSTCATAAAVASEEQEDTLQKHNPGTASAFYTCENDESIQFHAYYQGEVSPFYASSVYQCAPGTNFHIDIPIEAGRHGDVETDRISPNPMALANTNF